MNTTMKRAPSRICLTLALFADLVAGRGSTADDSTDPPVAAAEAESAEGTRRALIICGHPGDDEHRTLFRETIGRLQSALVERYGFDADAVWLLSGGEEPAAGEPVAESAHGPSTQESLQQALDELRAAAAPEDALWVFALGHAHWDGRHSWYNLPGPDLHEQTFAALFADIPCREQIFWITIPASGYYIQPLSAPGRIIISATAADRELNATAFPHVLATVLSTDPTAEPVEASEPVEEAETPVEEPVDDSAPAAASDAEEEPAPVSDSEPETGNPADDESEANVEPAADADPATEPATVEPGADAAATDDSESVTTAPTVQTLLDVYLAVTRRVAEQFAGDMQVATEHALLEANGDGRGAEIQYDYLSEELGGRLQAGESPPEPLPNSDAAAARTIILPLRAAIPMQANPVPVDEPAEAAAESSNE